jgi:DNA-binding CsgD family transcriptional regulator
MKQQVALRNMIRQLSKSGMPVGPLLVSALEPIRQLVPSDEASIWVIDARGEVRHSFADWLPDASARQVLDSTMAAALQSPGLLPPTVHRGACMLEESTRSTLRCSIPNSRDGAVILTLYRRTEHAAYSALEEGEFRDVMRHLAAGIQRAPPAPAQLRCAPRPRQTAVLLCDETGEVIHATGRGRGLFAMVPDLPLVASNGQPIKRCQSLLLQRLWDEERRRGPDRARMELVRDTFWGRISLRGWSGLDGTVERPLLAVRVAWDRPLESHRVEAIAKLGLSSQQAEIALALAVGLSGSEIANTLNISPNTVGYHVKRLYARLGVHDRAELLGVIHSSPPFQLMEVEDLAVA